MSLNTKNQKCAVCSAYLFEEDDIVYCPTCGAPHHRDCYNSIGKCGLEEFHGTDKEYRREEEVKEPEEPKAPTPPVMPVAKYCHGCGMSIEEGADHCTNCGLPVRQGFSPLAENNFKPIDKDAVIDEGVTAEDAAQIVRANAFRYIPKFLSLNRERKNSWNWAAFLLPHAWFAFRKMYKESIITTILMIASAIMSFPFSIAVAQLPLPESSVTNYLQLAEYYAGLLNEIGLVPLALSFLGLSIGVAVRIISGIYGDYIYKQRVVISARLIKKAEDVEEAKRKYSSTSFIGFIIAVLAYELIPSALSLFLL